MDYQLNRERVMLSRGLGDYGPPTAMYMHQYYCSRCYMSTIGVSNSVTEYPFKDDYRFEHQCHPGGMSASHLETLVRSRWAIVSLWCHLKNPISNDRSLLRETPVESFDVPAVEYRVEYVCSDCGSTPLGVGPTFSVEPPTNLTCVTTDCRSFGTASSLKLRGYQLLDDARQPPESGRVMLPDVPTAPLVTYNVFYQCGECGVHGYYQGRSVRAASCEGCLADASHCHVTAWSTQGRLTITKKMPRELLREELICGNSIAHCGTSGPIRAVTETHGIVSTVSI